MSEDRKARLAALAAKAGRNHDEDLNSDHQTNINQNYESNEQQKKVLKFRNYVPNDESIDRSDRMDEPLPKRIKSDVSKDGEPPQTELEKALSQAKVETALNESDNYLSRGQDEDTVLKKVNWDLKRDISKKLQKLQRQTEKKVVELLRERLEREEEASSDEDLD
jgi:coiled-coil domain-containing protein 12